MHVMVAERQSCEGAGCLKEGERETQGVRQSWAVLGAAWGLENWHR